jgi:hypothetical protein
VSWIFNRFRQEYYSSRSNTESKSTNQRCCCHCSNGWFSFVQTSIRSVSSTFFLKLISFLLIVVNDEFLNSLFLLKDPKNAHFRRGAPWTFDPQSIFNCLHKSIKKFLTFFQSKIFFIDFCDENCYSCWRKSKARELPKHLLSITGTYRYEYSSFVLYSKYAEL